MLTAKYVLSFFITLMMTCVMAFFIHFLYNSYFAYTSNSKKKILILTSSGGGGHVSATDALDRYLQGTYKITKLHIFTELLNNLDIFKVLTFNMYSAENLYNAFIRKNYYKLITLFYRFGAWYIYLQKENVRRLIYDYLVKTKPDLIISVIPFINYIVLDVAQELHIPFLLIPTDLDLKTYITYINNPTYEEFYLGLPFSDPEIALPLKTANIPAERTFVIGAPLRSEFFTQKDKSSIKHTYNIADNKPIVMLMMGAQGSDDIKTYLNHLIKLQDPVHLMVCIGKNKEIKNDIQSLELPNHISLSVMEFGVNIADLMAISDIIITKSGTLSIYEAIYSNLPMLLDATSAVLQWEKMNHVFIKKHCFGRSIVHYSDINSCVTRLLKNDQLYKQYKDNLEDYEKKKTKKEIKKLVKKIIIKRNPYQEDPDMGFF